MGKELSTSSLGLHVIDKRRLSHGSGLAPPLRTALVTTFSMPGVLIFCHAKPSKNVLAVFRSSSE
ncbi:hypothetical protein [Pseudomonas fluorescens]|uniref:hypothetical protein n=1 Tax=Pseudomonas fluorescens TaxID=294 RepID=UPI0012FDA239|nr:hypothetical protein [Pseudomonas fluorescens]